MIPRSTLSDFLSNMLRRWQGGPPPKPVTPAAAPPPKRRMSGELSALHTYLNDRYADMVILTFAEIESLTGFPLPAAARSDGSWWVPGATPARHTDAWTLAHRAATVNLPARMVSFERVAS